MRSPAEIWFRLRQEANNARLFVAAPSLPAGMPIPGRFTALPDPESFVSCLRGSYFERQITDLAEDICAHRIPLLGHTVQTGPEIRWRRDYIRDVETGTDYFRRIPYLNAARAGDHKIVWELNRHQHLVILAQAWLLTARREFLDEIPRQLYSWWEQNPYVRGINWASALEVAFRALSWVWIAHLTGPHPDLLEFRTRLLNEIYRHGIFLERNLSVYFSPNTHLLGEAVALHALGVLFPEWPRSALWKSLGGQMVAEQMEKQVRNDGSHFEQSSAYHIYALDLFLLHALLGQTSFAYRDKLRRMADYLAALSAQDGTVPFLGDDDGGSLFHPYGDRRRFGAPTLAACSVFFGRDDWAYTSADLPVQAAWWFGQAAFEHRPARPRDGCGARLFPDAGVAAISHAPAHIVIDTHGLGHGGAGHSHAHSLAIVCRHGKRDILIDPGTYTYVAEPEWRVRFRGTAFHNTIRIAGLDQATQAGPFRWTGKPATEVLRWIQRPDWCLLDACCAYRGFRHRRQLLWIPAWEMLAVMDVVEGEGTPVLEQFWHCGADVAAGSQGNYRIGSQASLSLTPGSRVRVETGGDYGWQSEVPGLKVARPVIVAERQAALPVVFGAVLFVSQPEECSLTLQAVPNGIRLCDETRWIELPDEGDPVINWGSKAT